MFGLIGRRGKHSAPPRTSEAIRLRRLGQHSYRRPTRTTWSLILLSCMTVVGTLGAIALEAGPAEAAPTQWSITPTPQPGSAGSTINNVSCTSPTFCVAVGDYSNGLRGLSLVETWNGRSWSVTPSPNPASADGIWLNGVSCTSPEFCAAVGVQWINPTTGVFNGYTPYRTLIETWNGRAWSITPSPNPGGTYDYLQGVSCTSQFSCVTVGWDLNGVGMNESDAGSLVESWNGRTWTLIPSPDPGWDNSFWSVSCTNARSCMALLQFSTTAGSNPQTVVESWNGRTWLVIPTPTPVDSSYIGGLQDVFCTSPVFCVVVGSYVNKSFVSETLVESWNGRTWSVVPSPSPGTIWSVLDVVSCTIPTNCVAIGGSNSGGTTSQTLIESWNGETWSVTPGPSTVGSFGLSCPTSTFCVGVGSGTVETGTTPTPPRWHSRR